MKNTLYIAVLSLSLTACLSYKPSALKDPNNLYQLISSYPKTTSCNEAIKKCDLQLNEGTAISLKVLSEHSGNMLILNYDKNTLATNTAAIQNTSNLLNYLGISHTDKIIELITTEQEKLNTPLNSNVRAHKNCTQQLTANTKLDTSIIISVNPGANCNIIMGHIF
ncbi:hypothetical protein [Azomonas agilis]|uniref:hypothetical protein n=1 Tax=Azomonas agilis TaxID=116849 RepID=UPI0011A0843D|nr:hypothetical protein [Azomonas agilis]